MTTAPVVVLDTNVVVAAQLSPYGAPGRIWDLVNARQLRLAYDDRILMEYAAVLARPKFKFPASKVSYVLSVFSFQERVGAATPWPIQPLPDPDDAMFLEVAAASSRLLISGNLRHYPEAFRGTVRVISPADWLGGYFER